MNHVLAIPSTGLSHSKEERTSENQMGAPGLPYLSYFFLLLFQIYHPAFLFIPLTALLGLLP